MNPLGKTEKMVRFSLIFTALLALLAALWAGLIRIGWPLPPIDLDLTMLHGPLMINGFLGLVIGIERAVALSSSGRTRIFWPYLSPICLAAGTLMLLLSGSLGALLITIGSLVLVAACIVVVRRQMALFTGVMALGALSWLIGNALWFSGQPIYSLVVWWMGFPLLTIIGERLELSRIVRLSKNSHRLFGVAAAIFGFGALFSVLNLDWGMRIAGLGELACALWLLRYDIARRTVNKAGKTRFIAICLLSGYGWLAVSGLLNLYSGVTYAGPFYDAALHTLFVGFAFSMIFGHALIILPAVLNITITFSRQLYVPLLVLHSSLLLRIAGDLLLLPEVRQWGGMLNEIAVLLFLGSIGYAIRKTYQAEKQKRMAAIDLNAKTTNPIAHTL
jgi:hypothetical protein